jgi:hypothetical protein
MSKSQINYSEQRILRTVYETTEVPKSVTIEISIEAAIVLRNITGSVAGCPRTSPRKYTDEIGVALHKLDLPGYGISLLDKYVSIKTESMARVQAAATQYIEQNTKKGEIS